MNKKRRTLQEENRNRNIQKGYVRDETKQNNRQNRQKQAKQAKRNQKMRKRYDKGKREEEHAK